MTDLIGTAEPEVGSVGLPLPVSLALHCDPHDPAPGAGWVHDKVETISVAMPP
nr:hypothetical protein [Celeribacter baekdonensis]